MKVTILKDKGNANNLSILNYHIVEISQICSLNNLTGKEFYLILVDANAVKPTAQDHFENLSETPQFNWKKNIFLFVIPLWIQRRVCSSIKSYIIFYIQTKCFSK